MKAVIISLILLLAVILAVCINNIYIKGVTQKLKSLAEEISQGDNVNKALYELENLWENSKKFTALSVGLEEIDQTTEHIIRLSVAYKNGDTASCEHYCYLLMNDFDDLGRYEKFSILNIL